MRAGSYASLFSARYPPSPCMYNPYPFFVASKLPRIASLHLINQDRSFYKTLSTTFLHFFSSSVVLNAQCRYLRP
jgi:hypothetical protein